MKKILLVLFAQMAICLNYIYAQTCTNDILILEDENLTVWEVKQNGTQIISLAGFEGSATVGGTTYTQTDFGFGEVGLIVMAHDFTGAFLWAQQLSTTEGFFTTNPALYVSPDVVYVAAAESQSSTSTHNLRIETFAALDGTPGWTKSYPVPISSSNLPYNGQVYPHSAVVDATGRLIISGAFSGSMTIGSTTLTTGAGLSETFVMAMNETDGTELWAIQSTGSTGRARAWTIEYDPLLDEIIIGGHFTGTVNFNGQSFSASDTSITNPYMAKLNPANGNCSWVVGMENGTANGFNNIYDIAVDGSSNIYYAGNFNDNINVQGTTITSEGGMDALIGSTTSNGTFRWASQLGGISTGSEFATTIEFGSNTSSLFIGAALATDSVYYANTAMMLPATYGHHVLGVGLDGSIDPIPANGISYENSFGYSSTYVDGAPSPDYKIMASYISGTGFNIKLTQWIPNRPIPIVDVKADFGTIQGVPADTLRAFDPGGSSYTYVWYRNGIATGNTSAKETVITNGEYYVEVSGSGGCVYRSESLFILDGSTLESDSLALVDLYNNTNGPNWNNNTNWLQPGSLVQNWFGVTVVGGRVTEIDLTFNNLDGTFPQSIGALSALQILRLNENNNLGGIVPNSIWNLSNLRELEFFNAFNLQWEMTPDIQNLTQLRFITAYNTAVTGTIPPEIGNLPSLEVLNVDSDENQERSSLSGTIPSEIGNISTLTNFQIKGSLITGSIPASMGNLSNLVIFRAQNCQLSGPLPPELGNLTNLVALRLENDFGSSRANNQLTGPIPTTYGNMSSLLEFNISNNPIASSVPVELGNLSSLTNFNLDYCQLQGTFPDEIWQIPTLQSIYLSGNDELTVNLPSNLASLTQFVDIRIDNTLPRGGDFPVDFYSLTNLQGLSLGNKRYTGQLTSQVGNWVNLDNIYLWNNLLEGDFPSEITNATNLRALNIRSNLFTSFPDLSGLSNLSELDVRNNRLDFNSIIPNTGVAGVLYSPQNRRTDQYLTVDEGGTLDLTNEYTTGGNQYQWVRNVNDSIATTQNYQIINASLNDLGGYFAWVTNSAVPDLTLSTPFYNVSYSGSPRSFSVDNTPGSIADFKTFYAAFYGTNDGDTLYVAGSAIPYNVGGLKLERPRIIFGPGYFLDENSETQATNLTAQVQFMNITEGADGTRIYGLDLYQGAYVNNITSYSDVVVSDIVLSNNKIESMAIVDDADNITISGNFINNFEFSSTTLATTSRNYTNIFIDNNIIDTVRTGLARATAARNDLTNVVFRRNTINAFLDSIQDVTLTNNIVNNYSATGNSVTNNRTYASASFINASGTLSIDNDFQPTNTGFTAGAFSGTNPYKLSGLGFVPHIYSLQDIGRIRIDVKAKNERSNNIQFLNYRLGENGQEVARGTVVRLDPGNPIETLFRPKLASVTPGATVNLMIWAKDDNGLKSTHHNLSFIAETTTATGQITTSTGAPLTSGEVLLFEINQEATAFDTLSTNVNNQGNFTFSNIVIGDYLGLGKPNVSSFGDQLPTYFKSTNPDTDLWEEADTLLIDTNNPSFNIKLIAKPKELTGNGVVGGFIEEELDQSTDAGGKIEARGRVRGAGVSMRRGSRDGKKDAVTYELISYTFSDDNGEFLFENLPEGDYRINIQYPGYPVDTLSDVDLVIETGRNNDYSLTALVDNGKISVTVLSTTGLLKEIVRQVDVYPNPAADYINIAFNEEENFMHPVNVEILSVSGERLYQDQFNNEEIDASKQIKIPLDIYKSGTYIIKLTSKNKSLGQIRLAIVK